MNRVALALALMVSGVVALAACGSKDERPPMDPAGRTPPAAEISELEIRGGGGVDRFAACPPPGELGQQWIPQLPEWTPPAPSADAGVTAAVDQQLIAKAEGRSATELAVEATHQDFRRCYRKSLIHGASEQGRVAIVVRIGPDGRVAKVEEYAACAIDPDAIACMERTAARLRFPPPASGSDTVVLPASFTSRAGSSRTVGSSNDAYAAGAYVTLETARPAFHACEERARRELRPLQATGTFVIDVAADGRVVRARVEPWTGEKSILECAARALDAISFAPPPGGRGVVVARLNFNPRQGTR